jgi:polar amino acid transport system substrate-binding protein
MTEKILDMIRLEDILICSLLVIIVIMITIFVYRKKRQSLQNFIDENVKEYQNVFSVSEDAIIILSDKYEILYANSAAIHFFSLKKHFKSTVLPMPKMKVKGAWVTLTELIKNASKRPGKKMQIFSKTTLMLGDSQEEVSVNLYFNNAYLDPEHKKPYMIIVLNDLKKEKAKVLLGSKHTLTKLPDQGQVTSDLNALYGKLHLDEHKIALVLMNIDNFSTLRSIVGYEQSNIILIRFAKYLNTLAAEFSFSVYYMDHNNFLLIMPNIESRKDILSVIKMIQYELLSFYKMENSNLHLTASAGVAIYPDNSNTLNLLDNTYKALTKAEKEGHGRIEIFEEDKGQHAYDELKLYNDMHQALAKNEFEVYYQPIVDAKTQEVVSAEALIRWNHPNHGLIAPYIFIPIMEKTGLIIELGKYVLEEVLKQQKRWELFKFKQVEVSINLSLLELETGKFVENVAQQLKNHQVPPQLIKFEITEGTAMSSEEQTSRQLLELKKIGIDISLDDFGTGYTSFAYLKKIPADILKIDRSLVMHVVENKEDQRIVKAMIELGHTLGMEIVVEGVENKEMYEMIVAMDCDYIQGYYFSKPLPVFEFQKLLR